jgi:hypothetical protein
MIAFKIHVKQQEDLLEEDASLSLGWFELSMKGANIELFRDGYCLVFITLDSLIEQLNALEGKKNSEKRWVGEDHGTVIKLSRDKIMLSMATSEGKICLPFEQFKDAVLQESKNFVDSCIKANPSINTESAFQDLLHSVEKEITVN